MMDNTTSHPAKRMRLAYHHRHKLQHELQQLPVHEPSVLTSKDNGDVLLRSVVAVCEEAASQHNILEPAIDSVALEALRNATEEFILQFCSKVRRSMIAARRDVPTATDFETAFVVLDLPRPDDQLPLYRTKQAVNPTLLPTPPPDDAFHNQAELPAAFLGPDLSRQSDLKKFALNSSFLPALPSAHTYKHSAVYDQRETDSRKIRELATEEGKLGEQALRKLATAVKLETALSTEPEARLVRAKRGPKRRKPALTEEAMFEETMRDLLHNEPGNFELGPIVTSEKAFRMPDDARLKRAPAASKTHTATSPVADTGQSKYNLLPPPMKKKQASRSLHPDAMDIAL